MPDAEVSLSLSLYNNSLCVCVCVCYADHFFLWQNNPIFAEVFGVGLETSNGGRMYRMEDTELDGGRKT